MKKVKIEAIGYLFDNPKEKAILKHCIDYCWHRLSKHSKTGLSKVVKLKDIEKLRNQI